MTAPTATPLTDHLEDYRCRFCGATTHRTFVDLGMSPLCESFIDQSHRNHMEPFYPLHVVVCERCLLVQLQEYVSPSDIFSHYAYFSSFSDSWLHHARAYVGMISDRLNLGKSSFVVELASNDGYLLQNFIDLNIPAMGIEPAANVAQEAIRKGVPTMVRFFGTALAQELVKQGKQADLIIGNNVLAHVPDLNGFVQGMKLLLKPQGVITMEFPHLMRLMEDNQFDTIYHEHFSYFSFFVVESVFAAHGLTLFDVEELPTHGGSLRIYARHTGDTSKPISRRVASLRAREEHAGLMVVESYALFTKQVEETKFQLLEFLIQAKREGKTIVGYGAPGKGNTLLNYCGIRTEFLDYTVDRNPFKHGKYLPGTHIPIFSPEKIRETKPDYVLILPWNLQREIVAQLAYIQAWGGQCVVPIPTVQVVS